MRSRTRAKIGKTAERAAGTTIGRRVGTPVIRTRGMGIRTKDTTTIKIRAGATTKTKIRTRATTTTKIGAIIKIRAITTIRIGIRTRTRGITIRTRTKSNMRIGIRNRTIHGTNSSPTTRKLAIRKDWRSCFKGIVREVTGEQAVELEFILFSKYFLLFPLASTSSFSFSISM